MNFEDLKIEDVGEILDFGNIVDVANQIQELLSASLPVYKKKVVGDVKKEAEKKESPLK